MEGLLTITTGFTRILKSKTTNKKYMHNNNLEGGTEVNIKSHNKGTIVVVSYDKQG